MDENVGPRTHTMFLLAERGRQMTAAVETIWGDIGVSPSEAAVLARLIVTHGGDARSGALLGYPIRSTPALAKVLASLEAEGLVERSRSAEDGRIVIVKATTDAHDLFGHVLRRIETEVTIPTTQNLDNQEITSLHNHLHDLTPPPG